MVYWYLFSFLFLKVPKITKYLPLSSNWAYFFENNNLFAFVSFLFDFCKSINVLWFRKFLPKNRSWPLNVNMQPHSNLSLSKKLPISFQNCTLNRNRKACKNQRGKGLKTSIYKSSKLHTITVNEMAFQMKEKPGKFLKTNKIYGLTTKKRSQKRKQAANRLLWEELQTNTGQKTSK